jgi:hypothetical protein
MPVPADKKLYAKVVADAKKRFMVWPSAYASGWVVKTYKQLGGTYTSTKGKEKKTLDRWFKEKWIDVCELPKIVPCGRTKADITDYPYCRPMKRITGNTPKTAGQLNMTEIKKRCAKKKKEPMKRILDKK